jgi:adenylylsulfate kinase-like enzyme
MGVCVSPDTIRPHTEDSGEVCDSLGSGSEVIEIYIDSTLSICACCTGVYFRRIKE